MKKLLYITVNSKPEHLSTCKRVGREFVNRFLDKNKEYVLEELDLYNSYVPEGNYKIFKKRADLVTGAEYNALSDEDKKTVDRMNELCEQFLSADTYVVAAPMWSVSFPGRLKTYIDCIVQNNKLIRISNDEVSGLLGDKERFMVYIQSSGGIYPKLFESRINHGVNYFNDIFKFLGIKKFKKVLVEGVDLSNVGEDKAVARAYEDIDDVIDSLSHETLFEKITK